MRFIEVMVLVTTVVRSADGRRLAVRVSGNPAGYPVVYLHGTPGSRMGPFPRERVLYHLGVRLISFDRPGYGGSDRLASRRVADVVPDVQAIVDQLGVQQFAVLGRSGGGPHALACAALLPQRVSRAGALVSIAPRSAEGLDWFAGMSKSNVHEFTTASSAPDSLMEELAAVAAKIKADPLNHVPVFGADLPEPDRRLMADVGIRTLLADNFREALRDSAAGWIDDSLAFCSPWGFDPADIRIPVLLWHGEKDVFSPAAHTRWLARRIRNSELRLLPDTAHFGALEVVPDVLSWLIRS
jgi:pimeloyl-ACP methyl ester carboxylesterase